MGDSSCPSLVLSISAAFSRFSVVFALGKKINLYECYFSDKYCVKRSTIFSYEKVVKFEY
jgi:hypothetical protein